jgi:hypothetical protein
MTIRRRIFVVEGVAMRVGRVGVVIVGYRHFAFCEGAGSVHSLSGFPGSRIQLIFRTELARIVKDKKDSNATCLILSVFVAVEDFLRIKAAFQL